jgi:hypothetical protein
MGLTDVFVAEMGMVFNGYIRLAPSFWFASLKLLLGTNKGESVLHPKFLNSFLI